MLFNKKLIASQRENSIPAIRFYFSNVSKSFFLPKLSRFINKNLYKFFGLGSSINRYDNSITIYSGTADRFLYKNYKKNDKFINFGSGAFFHNRWTNYDYPGQSDYYKCLQGVVSKDFHSIDLCNKFLNIPEKDESVSLIYCAHTLEHLDNKSCDRFLVECLRILKKEGVLRVALPNTKNDFYLAKCLMSQNNINNKLQENYLRDAAYHILAGTQEIDIEELKNIFKLFDFDSELFFMHVSDRHPQYKVFDGRYPERHVNYIDFKVLMNFASKAGFSCVIPSYQGSSVADPFKNLHVFDTTEPHLAIYADIIK